MMIPNYGEMCRYDEPVSTAFVESTINEVIASRMAKKQQMQWSREGDHYLLQARAAVLNNDLQDKFSQWYPGFKTNDLDEDRMSAIAAKKYDCPTLFYALQVAQTECVRQIPTNALGDDINRIVQTSEGVSDQRHGQVTS